MAPPPLPSFSAILLDPTAPHLPLPHAFVRKHLEKKIPENPILRSVNGGYSWRLKIKQVGGNYCFVDGWKEVVEDSQLGYADFLVFWLVDPSTFKLSVFSPNGCGRDFPVENHDVNQEEADDKKKEEKDVSDFFEGDPFFTKTMTKARSDKFYLKFPLEFARLAGLDRERTVTMKNLEGKEWQMSLKLDRHHYIRYYLSGGWSKFRQDNELLEGYECVFKFIKSEDKFCLAKVNKKRDLTRHPADKAQDLKRRSSGRSKKRPAGKIRAVEVFKRPRGRPRRADMVEKMVVAGGNVAAGEVLKRPRGRPSCVKVVEKNEQSKNSVGKAPPAAEIVKRKRGRPRRVEVVKEDEGAEVVKRPRGRPFKRKRGRPAGGSC